MCCCGSYFTRVTDILPLVAIRRTIFKFRSLVYLPEKRTFELSIKDNKSRDKAR